MELDQKGISCVETKNQLSPQEEAKSNSKTENSKFDWMEVNSKIIIPIVIGLLTIATTVAGLLYSWNAEKDRASREVQDGKTRAEQARIADERRQDEDRFAKEARQHQIMAAYLEQMTKLILENNLSSPYSSDDVRSVGRAITLNATRQLVDGDRKGQLLKFLYEADLIGGCDSVKTQPGECQDAIIELRGIKLDQAEIDSSLNLMGIDLRGAVLPGAKLPNIFLDKAEVTGATLTDAILSGALLHDVQMEAANLEGANLVGAQLLRSNLKYSLLRGANLTKANLKGADLRCAELQAANLTSADLAGAQFKNATYGATDFPDGFDPKAQGMIEVKPGEKRNGACSIE